jgi:hypothetical protein
MAPFGGDTTLVLRNLHPEGPPVQPREEYPEGIELDVEGESTLVLEMLMSFKKGTASGRSGWSATHLQEC